MDIAERIKEFALYPQMIQRAFYDEKLEMLLEQQRQDPNITEMQDCCSKETLEKFFPEATIKPIRFFKLLIKLQNADFYIDISGRDIVIKRNDYWSPLRVNTIPNLIEYINEVDRRMPEWEKEFADQIAALGNDIRDKQRNWVLKGKRSVDSILEYRIEMFLMECRDNSETGTALNKTLSEANLSFENFSVIAKDDYVSIRVSKTCRKDFHNKEIGIERLKQLDKMIPIWQGELDPWNVEYKRLEKTKDVGDLSVTALIKKKMKSLGCEYYIKRNFKSMSLYIKIDQECMTKLFLPYNSFGLIRKRLDSIDLTHKDKGTYNAFKMKLMEKQLKWTREKPETEDE